MAGVMVASYGNAVLGQMPTALLIYASMAIMSNPEIFEAPIKEKEPELIALKPTKELDSASDLIDDNILDKWKTLIDASDNLSFRIFTHRCTLKELPYICGVIHQ